MKIKDYEFKVRQLAQLYVFYRRGSIVVLIVKVTLAVVTD